MSLTGFHPLVAEWFTARFGEPTPPQGPGWAEIRKGQDTLIAAPTGSGKTLAAFLWGINELVEAALDGGLQDETKVVYVSPLKALSNDIKKNLQEPLEEIAGLASRKGLQLPEIRVAVRTGDTPARERVAMVKRPPHILITTPESLYILLTAERSRKFLSTANAVIVDEIHAVAGDKRGSHLALSLERLDRLAGRPIQRIGLSATQKPIEEIARLLVGAGRLDESGQPIASVIDGGHARTWDLSIEVPGQPLGPIAIHELWGEIYDRIVALAGEHQTTLVFVNTRRLAERVAHQLSMRMGEGKVATHHGSLSREIRLKAEQGLKSGEVPVVVATASLELGIDIGHVELVCHLGAPRSLATMLQRVGRSGHFLESIPKGILFPLTRDELLQCAAAVRAARAGELDQIVIPKNALDIVAQQMVAISAAEEIPMDEMKTLVKRAYSYRNLSDKDFDDVVEMLTEGVATRHGRRSAHLHYDRINGVVKGRRGARLISITNGGAIPEVSDFDVVEEPDENFVGKVNEDFAIESSAGDIFLLGNTSWKIRRIESIGKVRVENAHGAPPTVPFWVGEAPARTPELSQAVGELREMVAGGISDRETTIAGLMEECGVDRAGAEQIFDYVNEILASLGCVPTQKRVVVERFFDEGGGMQVIVHAPFGARVNRAWGLALRKRFCVTFDFELQAAATDDGIVLSLGEQHSFPLESVFNFVRPNTMEEAVQQAVLQSPMFGTRWRWNVTRALALLRYSGGKKVPFQIQRMRSEDLLSAVFPEQVACQDNTVGPIHPPDHPLVNETLANCMHELMDIDGLMTVLEDLESGAIEKVAIETPAPSAASHEILNANPFAFLDDAPLEERRARAVALRRTDPELAKGAGALDADAIATVIEQAQPDIRDKDELHDHLLTVGVIPLGEAAGWSEMLRELVEAGRIAVAHLSPEARVTFSSSSAEAYVASERKDLIEAAYPEVTFEPEISLPESLRTSVSREEAVRSIVHGWIQVTGPTTVGKLSEKLALSTLDVESSLLSLEGQGVVLRGTFTDQGGSGGVAAPQGTDSERQGLRSPRDNQGGSGGVAAPQGTDSERQRLRSPRDNQTEWCDRRLLARIHRLTINRLRQEIDPVTPADFMRFLFKWQHVQPATQLHGREGLLRIIGQLQGLELPAPSWESTVFPARLGRYDPNELEYLCLSGMVTWGRLSPPSNELDETEFRKGRGKPSRNTPLAFVLREELHNFVSDATDATTISSAATEVLEFLQTRGASFMSDIVKGGGRMPAEVEEALWELVSSGLVTGDGVAGLRRLLNGSHRPQDGQRSRRLRALPGVRATTRPLPVGRWAIWLREPVGEEERDEALAQQLLMRYGVVFRELLARERSAPSWRRLVSIYRRWEAQQRIRGGRFVSGLVGEQFALPEAVETLRSVRRSQPDDEVLMISAADPTNFVGILLPGARVSPLSGLWIAFKDGIPLETATLGDLRSKLRTLGLMPAVSRKTS